MAKFIVFEGLDKHRKTTQINLLKKVLSKENFIFTSCPGGSETAKQVRSILANSLARKTMAKETEVLLYAASHSDVTHGIIAPALQDGKTIICDRYIHSALAYQVECQHNFGQKL
jgi:dTMP kinase